MTTFAMSYTPNGMCSECKQDLVGAYYFVQGYQLCPICRKLPQYNNTTTKKGDE